MALPLGEPVKAVIGTARLAGLARVLALHEAIHFRTEEPGPAADGGDGLNQFLFDAILQDVAPGAFSNSPHNIPLIGMHAEDQNGNRRQQAAQLAESFQAIQALHTNIQHDEVGLVLQRQFNRLATGTGFRHNTEIGLALQDPSNALAYQGVIVGK